MIHSVRKDWWDGGEKGRCRPHTVAISSSHHLMTVVIVFALPVSCSFLADLIAFLLLLWRLFYLSWQHITHRKHMPLATLLGLVLLKQHRMAGSFQPSCDYSATQTISVQYPPFQKRSCHNLFPAFLGGTFISMGVLNYVYFFHTSWTVFFFFLVEQFCVCLPVR